MNLVQLGCTFRTTPVEIREKLAFTEPQLEQALREITARFGWESAVLSTCNRVEVYAANPQGIRPDPYLLREYLAQFHNLDPEYLGQYLQIHEEADVVLHLFRVAASLDSLIVGEGQIAGQVRDAFETALRVGSTGPMLNALFQYAQKAAKRVRTETGITEGHISVSSVAVDFVKQVFDRFSDKTVLVIGAGKMGRLTLKHLQELKPKQILITNRSPEKAQALAQEVQGQAVPFERLDDCLAQADIVLSTTGSPDPIMTEARYAPIRQKKGARTTVILDIAVPRDFDPNIHDGERTFVFNVDDLTAVREQTLAKRRSHLERAEHIIREEQRKFLEEWTRRKHGPTIARLTKFFDDRRQEILQELLARLNGKISEKERRDIEGAFRLFQNRLLHSPISALVESARDGTSNQLLESLKRLFQIGDEK